MTMDVVSTIVLRGLSPNRLNADAVVADRLADAVELETRARGIRQGAEQRLAEAAEARAAVSEVLRREIGCDEAVAQFHDYDRELGISATWNEAAGTITHGVRERVGRTVDLELVEAMIDSLREWKAARDARAAA